MKEVQIVYRAGKDNKSADALSRAPRDTTPLPDDSEDAPYVAIIFATCADEFSEVPKEPDCDLLSLPIPKEQRMDKMLSEIFKFKQGGTLPSDAKRARTVATQDSRFAVENGILYYLDPETSRKRAVVPKSLKDKVMRETHGGPFSGHFSGQRLFKVLSRVWWWKGMYSDAINHAKRCLECALATGGARPGHPPLNPIPVQRPFQILGTDVMDLPKTERGNKHVLVFQDFLTKWPLVFPMPDQKMERIVKILVDEVVPLFGVPEALLSHRGTNFLSRSFNEGCLLSLRNRKTKYYSSSSSM